MRIVNLNNSDEYKCGGLEEINPLAAVHLELIKRAHGEAVTDIHRLNGGEPVARDLSLRDRLTRDRMRQAFPGRYWSNENGGE